MKRFLLIAILLISGYAAMAQSIRSALISRNYVHSQKLISPSVKRVDVSVGTMDSSGKYSVTFSTSSSSVLDTQITRIGVETDRLATRVIQRNSVNLLSTELLLTNTANTSGATVHIRVTPI